MLSDLPDGTLQCLLINQRCVAHKPHQHSRTTICTFVGPPVNLLLRFSILHAMERIHRLHSICEVVEHAAEHVVLEVGSDILVLDLALNACGLEHGGVTNAGELQDLRALDRTSRQDDLSGSIDLVSLAVGHELDPSRDVSIKYDLADHGLRQNFQIFSPSVRKQVTSRSVASSSGICCSIDSGKTRIESHMITRPCIDESAGLAVDRVCSFAEIVLEWLGRCQQVKRLLWQNTKLTS